VVPQQIDWNRFSSNKRSKDILDELKIPKDFVVGFVGRLSPEKNIPVIIECAKYLKDISFVIVGDGPQMSPLRQLSKDLENVFFTGNRTDLEKIYPALDVLVLPSLVEGLPLVILEAMASGTPVIASDVGAVSEAVIDYLSGLLLWNPNDANLLANYIMKMKFDTVFWNQCSINSIAIAKSFESKGKQNNINTAYSLLFRGG